MASRSFWPKKLTMFGGMVKNIYLNILYKKDNQLFIALIYSNGGERFKNVTANIKKTVYSSVFKKEEKKPKKSKAAASKIIYLCFKSLKIVKK